MRAGPGGRRLRHHLGVRRERRRWRRWRGRRRCHDRGRLHPARRADEEGARPDGGPDQHPRLAGLRRGRHQRPHRGLGDAVREEDRLPGQRQVLRHLRRGGQPDEDRRVRRGLGLG